MHWIDNRGALLLLAALLSGVCVLISTLESIRLLSHFRDDGIFSWVAASARSKHTCNGTLGKFCRVLYGYPNFIFLLSLRVVCIFGLFLNASNYFAAGLICLLIGVTSILINMRGRLGGNGADQIASNTIIVAGIALCIDSKFVQGCALVFLAIQVALAYATPSWLRVFQSSWWTGEDLMLIIRSQSYGNRHLWRFMVERRKFTIITSFIVIAFESLFPFSLFLPFPYVIIFLIFGFLFHLMNSFIMGLNTFTWAFLAGYAPCLWLSHWINQEFYSSLR